MTSLDAFRQTLKRRDALDALRSGLIGDGVEIETPFGTQSLLYADYVASGRALAQVEDFVARAVLPYYANSHTEASFCGEMMTRMRAEARAVIAQAVGAGPDCHVVFGGGGATAGLNRIAGLLRLRDRVMAGERVVVLIGPYEHHSNILPWRETGAELRMIPEAPGGGVDLAALEAELLHSRDAGCILGSFSAASNVTGIVTDPDPVTRLLKRHGALAVWDYAGGGPYLPMRMTPSPDAAKDAIVFSPHKFPGGPGASGVLILRDSVIARETPTLPGGGTVRFVSPRGHDYSADVSVREEGGTPNVVGDIRAALAVMVKEVVGTDAIGARDAALRARALNAWSGCPPLELLGSDVTSAALPIFSFRIRDGAGGFVHHQLVTRMLSDHYGIQARGGCACAGPYAHALLGLDDAASDRLRARILSGDELAKPGWTRLNLSWLHSDAQAARIIDAVADLAYRAPDLARHYLVDPATARFRATAVTGETA